MPGYEVIDNKEFKQISQIFKKVKLYLGWVLDKQRKGIFKVREFEKNFARKFKSKKIHFSSNIWYCSFTSSIVNIKS